MIERRVIFEIHRMADSGLSIRRIAKALHLDRQTVGKYPADPNPARATVVKPGKLDPLQGPDPRVARKRPRGFGNRHPPASQGPGF